MNSESAEDNGDRKETGHAGEANGKPFDYEQLLQQWNGKEEFVAKVLRLFETEASSDILELSKALEAEDADNLGKLAHRIKGSSATVGAERIRSLAAKIEIYGREKDCAAATPYVAELGQELEQYRIHMQNTL